MKHLTIVLSMITLSLVLALCAACEGGSFMDPGHVDAGVWDISSSGPGGYNGGDYDYDYDNDDDDDDDSGGIPSKLSYSASKSDAIAKLDQIIAYCEANPSGSVSSTSGNTYRKSLAESLKTNIQSPAGSWDSLKTSYINSINGLIDLLD
jgi:hypothetical protein